MESGIHRAGEVEGAGSCPWNGCKRVRYRPPPRVAVTEDIGATAKVGARKIAAATNRASAVSKQRFAIGGVDKPSDDAEFGVEPEQQGQQRRLARVDVFILEAVQSGVAQPRAAVLVRARRNRRGCGA